MQKPILDHARVVARLTGTLPDGGYEEDTPIYAVDLPDLLRPENAPQPHREEVDLGGKLAFTLEDVATREECAHLIAVTEALGFRDAAPGINTPPGMRRNKTVHWIAPKMVMAELYRRVAPLLPQEIDGRKLSPLLSHRINTYRYDKGDEFNLHIDGDWPGFGLSQDGSSMVQWAGTHSMLTMLLYLNGAEDGLQGGSTTLYDQGELRATVTPKTGRSLFFRHGSNRDTVLHAGDRLTGDVPKYVARINVMYDF
ncbi:2OG-Fe(II) oxygenase [Thioclava sp. FR2]|uniref:2OG-Fe(II) oxygenase n=1 Tax=Thioclava sp. FR2 TaxID=3445780 RepID=UPI003EBFD7E0